MARYVTSVRSPRTVQEAFDYMADLRNFATWDPGVRSVKQVVGTGPAPDAVFDVVVASVGRDMTLQYKITEFDAPNMVLAVAKTSTLKSTDRITVRPDGDGCIVTYDADLQLLGPLKLFDFGLKLVFGKIGDRAAAGMRKALDGTKVAS